MSTTDDDALELAVESALAEYLVRCDNGTAPDREQFLAKHPEMRERLESLLAAADWIEQLAGPTMAAQASAAQASASPVPGMPPGLPAYGSPARAANDQASQSGGEPKPFMMMVDPNDDTHPHSPLTGGMAEPSRPDLSLNASDPNAMTLPGASRAPVPGFSLGSLTPAQEVSQTVLPCRFGDYVLEKVLGRGGMGVVYAGHQTHLDRAVAIKMIRSGALASSEEVQRFYTEARSAAKLDHPNIVTVYQCGEQGGHHFFSMDLVVGTDLAKLIQDGAMEPRRAARYVRDVAQAIQYAHDRGILHRDLKPANVLVDEKDEVHVTDFGLAKTVGHETGLTATGAALGTPSYMSPEQAAGRTVEHAFQTDVYSLGAVLFALVTGKPPFQCPSVVQTIMQVMHRPAPLARTVNPSVPADIETIIAKCLHKSPDRRYETASQLADDLERYLCGEPIKARPLSPMRRAIYWVVGLPIMRVLLGRRMIEPNAIDTWLSRGMVAAVFLVAMMLWFSPWRSAEPRQRMPTAVRLAAGQAGGSYDYVGRVLAKAIEKAVSLPTTPLVTEGSLDNRRRLIEHHVELALLQGSTIKSDELVVVAPLYYEAVHVLVRDDLNVKQIADLKSHRIVIGPEGSGSRAVAKRILQKHHLELTDIDPVSSDWLSMDGQADVEGAIIVVQVGNARMRELLTGGRYHLLPLDDAVQFSLDDPAFRLLPITSEYYPNAKLPPGGLNTIATAAYLTSHVNCPDTLVRKALEAVYSSEVRHACQLLSPERVADWDVHWHRAAKEFYEPFRNN